MGIQMLQRTRNTVPPPSDPREETARNSIPPPIPPQTRGYTALLHSDKAQDATPPTTPPPEIEASGEQKLADSGSRAADGSDVRGGTPSTATPGSPRTTSWSPDSP